MNKLIEVYTKEEKTKMTEDELLEQLNQSAELSRKNKSKGGITVKGIDDVAVHFSKCCSPFREMRLSDLLPEDAAFLFIVLTVSIFSVWEILTVRA